MPDRILLRAYKNPFRVASPKEVYRKNLIGNNVGNLLFSNASYKLLDVKGTQIVTDPLLGGKAEAARINADFDHVVIPLANAFRPSYVEQLVQLTETIRALTIPVTVLGIGAQMGMEGDPKRLNPIRDQVQDFVRAVLEKSPTIGVRGQFTYDYLLGLGFNDIEIIGCPSLFMNGPAFRMAPKDALNPESKVSLNLSPYVPNLVELVNENAVTYPNLRYAAQHRDALGMLLYTNAPEPQKSEQKLLPTVRSHDLVASHRTSFFVDPAPWISYLSNFQFSFGTRIHGNIAAILAGTPAHVLAHDSRTLELARYHDIPHTSAKKLESVDAADLHERSDYTAFNARQRARFHTFSTFLHAQNLTHVFDPGQDPYAYERKVAATSYPGDVSLIQPTKERSVRQSVKRLLGR